MNNLKIKKISQNQIGYVLYDIADRNMTTLFFNFLLALAEQGGEFWVVYEKDLWWRWTPLGLYYQDGLKIVFVAGQALPDSQLKKLLKRRFWFF